MANGLVSQWLSVGEYRSLFCIAKQSNLSAWKIEGRLPNGDIIELAEYATELFDPANPRYVTMKAMCGIPIRFVATTQQTNAQLWVVVKS
ncbi:hypothetical protein SH501x_001340 [Pirellulaceae bacterium SH501]